MAALIVRTELGPADGLRVAIKDSINVEGIPTRLGSAACETAAPAKAHADVVTKILRAGHQIVGKTVMHELAFGMTGINHYAGTPENINYPNFIPGGSSSGSAVVVADGTADFAIGTDTGGSVRLPAACCGVFGFKPTFGRINREGIWPEQTSLDCVGPFAATLSLLEQAQQAIDPSFNLGETTSSEIKFGMTLNGVVRPEIAAAFRKYLEDSGVIIGQAELPLIGKAFGAGMTIINAETVAATRAFLETGLVGADVAVRLSAAADTTLEQVAAAEQVRQEFSRQVDAQLEVFDVLVMPALPDYPLRLDAALAGKTDLGMSALVRPFNLSGHPGLVIPFEVEGSPVGIQLIGRKDADDEVFLSARELIRRSAVLTENTQTQ